MTTTILLLLIGNLVGLIFLYKVLSSFVPKKSTAFFSAVSIYDNNQLFFNLKGKLKIKIMKLKDTQQVVGTLSFVDKKGKPTDVPDGGVSVSIVNTGDAEDGSIATADYDDDKNQVTVKAVGPGVAALRIVATNAAGEVLPFDDVAIEVTAGDAQGVVVEFGDPTEQEG